MVAKFWGFSMGLLALLSVWSQTAGALELTGVLTAIALREARIEIDNRPYRIATDQALRDAWNLGVGERVQIEVSGYELMGIRPAPDARGPVRVRDLTRQMPN
jgi:hypothetical protein